MNFDIFRNPERSQEARTFSGIPKISKSHPDPEKYSRFRHDPILHIPTIDIIETFLKIEKVFYY